MKKKILVIDDEEILTRTLVKMLEKFGFDAYFVKSGEDAIEIIKDIHFDIIISDVRMPGKNGVVTITEIRQWYKNENKNHPPEIIITGYAEDHLDKQIESLKPAVYLQKPFDMEVLMGHVRRLAA